jgi:hypothetical protein
LGVGNVNWIHDDEEVDFEEDALGFNTSLDHNKVGLDASEEL